jgi:hypothetical protein
MFSLPQLAWDKRLSVVVVVVVVVVVDDVDVPCCIVECLRRAGYHFGSKGGNGFKGKGNSPPI